MVRCHLVIPGVRGWNFPVCERIKTTQGWWWCWWWCGLPTDWWRRYRSHETKWRWPICRWLSRRPFVLSCQSRSLDRYSTTQTSLGVSYHLHPPRNYCRTRLWFCLCCAVPWMDYSYDVYTRTDPIIWMKYVIQKPRCKMNQCAVRERLDHLICVRWPNHWNFVSLILRRMNDWISVL